MAIDSIIFNPNYKLYGFIKISFDYTMNGVLSKNIETTTFPVDLYTNNWTRLLLEIIYLIIVIVKSKHCIKSCTKIYFIFADKNLSIHKKGAFCIGRICKRGYLKSSVFYFKYYVCCWHCIYVKNNLQFFSILILFERPNIKPIFTRRTPFTDWEIGNDDP